MLSPFLRRLHRADFNFGKTGQTCFPKIKGSLLLVATRRRIYAAGAIRRRSAPNALVPAGAVPMHLVRSIYAAAPVACAAAPLAVLFVVAVLVGLVRTVDAATTIARTAAMPTFACHLELLSFAHYTKNSAPRPQLFSRVKHVDRVELGS